MDINTRTGASRAMIQLSTAKGGNTGIVPAQLDSNLQQPIRQRPVTTMALLTGIGILGWVLLDKYPKKR
jgi:hypothetical protein